MGYRSLLIELWPAYVMAAAAAGCFWLASRLRVDTGRNR